MEENLSKLNKSQLIELIQNERSAKNENNNLLTIETIQNLLDVQFKQFEVLLNKTIDVKFKQLEVDLAKRIEDIEEQLNKIQTENEQLHGEIATLKLKDNQKKMDSENSPISIQKEELLNEFEMRERKKLNLVVFGLEETNTDNEANDQTKMILNILQLPNLQISTLKPGKKINGKKRLVIMKCHNLHDKLQILKNAKKLKYSPMEHISITPDLTKLQQVQNKELRNELNRRRNGGESVKIKNGEIIKV